MNGEWWSALPPLPLPHEMQQWDKQAVELGILPEILMENAAAAAFRQLSALCPRLAGKQVWLLMGSGNNGGDGFVVARKLAEENFAVTAVLLCGQPKSAQAREMYSRMEGLGVSVLIQCPSLWRFRASVCPQLLGRCSRRRACPLQPQSSLRLSPEIRAYRSNAIRFRL